VLYLWLRARRPTAEGIFFSFFLKFILVKFKLIPAEFKATVRMQRVLCKLEAKILPVDSRGYYEKA
jgi:hypothetical protein